MNSALFKNFSCQFSFEKQLVLSLFRSHANILPPRPDPGQAAPARVAEPHL